MNTASQTVPRGAPGRGLLHAGGVRVALVAETFLPQMNGVVGSLLHVLKHLRAHGHETLVIAPRHEESPDPRALHGAELALLPSIPTPGYPELRLTVTSALRLSAILREFRPDVVHLASPFLLGWQALRAADALGIPTVAVYQTDVPGYAQRYGIPGLAPAFSRHVARIHQRATLTLAPSTSALAELDGLGVTRLRHWARGVDGVRFHPGRRDERWRRQVAPDDELVIGYVGRLAPEKQVADLAAIASIPGTRLVIVGDGPERPALEQAMPDAVFLGFLEGEPLARAVAGFDVFVQLVMAAITTEPWLSCTSWPPIRPCAARRSCAWVARTRTSCTSCSHPATAGRRRRCACWPAYRSAPTGIAARSATSPEDIWVRCRPSWQISGRSNEACSVS